MRNQNPAQAGLAEDFGFLRDFTPRNFAAFLRERKALAVTLLVSVLFMYGLKLAHYLYGVDTEMHMEVSRFVNWLSIGRFGLVALQKLWMRGTFFNPFSAIFAALVCLYFGTLFFCYLLCGFSRRTLRPVLLWIFALTFASGGVWCEQLYFTLQCAECILIMALVPAAVWLLYCAFALGNRAAAAANIVLVVFITSVYQAVLPLYACAALACYMLERDSCVPSDGPRTAGEKARRKMAAGMILATAAAVILYFAVSDAVRSLSGAAKSDYLAKMVGGKTHDAAKSPLIYFLLYLYKLTVGNIAPVADFFAPVFARHARSGAVVLEALSVESVYANFLYIPAAVLFLIFALRNSRRSAVYILCAVSVLLCVFALPFAGGWTAGTRTAYVVPFAAAFMFIYVAKNFRGAAFRICAAVLLAGCFYAVQLIGNLNYSDKLRFDADVRLAADLDARLKIYADKNGVARDTPVYFFGAADAAAGRNFIRGESCGHGSFYHGYDPGRGAVLYTANNGAGESSRRPAFMNTLLTGWTVGRDGDVLLACAAAAEEMPPYPAEGCVKFYDGALLVKLSDAPYEEAGY